MIVNQAVTILHDNVTNTKNENYEKQYQTNPLQFLIMIMIITNDNDNIRTIPKQ